MYLPADDAAQFARMLEECAPASDRTLFVAVAGDLGRDLPDLVAALRRRGGPFFGGVFPGLVDAGRTVDRGAIVQALPLTQRPHLVRSIDAATFDLNGVATISAHEGAAFVLVDALSRGTGRFLNRLYHHAGASVACFGAGAGSLAAGHAPCLFTADGAFRDAALVAPLPWRGEMRASHGWRRLGGPLVATRTDGNVILELNWDVARDGYAAAVKVAAGAEIRVATDAHAFPLGLRRDADEDVVRDVVGWTHDGGLVCTGSVPEHAVLHVLACSDDLPAPASAAPEDPHPPQAAWGLVAASATRLCCDGAGPHPSFDRLAARFAHAGVGVLDGLLTLGEICSRGGRIELDNKTIAAGLFYPLADAGADGVS